MTPAYQRTGLVSLGTETGLQLFDAVLALMDNQPVCVPCMHRSNGSLVEEPLKSELDSRPAATDVSTKLRDNDFKKAVLDWLKSFFAEELKLDIEHLDAEKPFQDYGMDSILLAELLRATEKRLGMSLAPSLFYEYTSLLELSDYLCFTCPEVMANVIDSSKVIHVTTVLPASETAPDDTHNPSSPARISQSLVKPEDIAVIGLACRMPGSPNKDLYWKMLAEGSCAITRCPLSVGRMWGSPFMQV